MWFEDQGPALTTLLKRFANQLDSCPAALWIAHRDGRNYFEERPCLQYLRQDRQQRKPNQKELVGKAALPELFSEITFVDLTNSVDLQLVLECACPYPPQTRLGQSRTLTKDSSLYRLLSNPQKRTTRFVDQTIAGLFHLPDLRSELFAYCLEIDGSSIGILVIPYHTGLSTRRINKIWQEEKPEWERYQIEHTLVRRTQTLVALQAIGNTITAQLEIHDILQSVVLQTTVLMKAKITSLMLVSDSGNELVLESVYGSSPDYVNKPNLDIDHSLLGQVVKTKQPLLVMDVRECPQYSHRDIARTEGLVSLLSVPLLWKEKAIGVLNVYSAHRYRYLDDGIYLLTVLASQAAIAIQNARSLMQRQLLEEQVNELDKRSLVGELAAGVAHEIRNPLAAVQMLIGSWEAPSEEQSRDVAVILQQLNGINRCVEQLLEVARPQPPEMQTVQIADEILNLGQVLRVRLRDQGITLKTQVGDNLYLVRGDPSRLRQLFMNLFLNALNAMPDQGIIDISIFNADLGKFTDWPGIDILPLPPNQRSSHENEGVLVEFQDQGGGFVQKNLKEMFEPFHKSTSGGLGLGLSIVRHIAVDHQIGLKISNRPGDGVTYCLFFRKGDPYNDRYV